MNNFIVMNGTPLYLRNLQPELRMEMEREIREDYPELQADLENGDDIQIGVFLRHNIKA